MTEAALRSLEPTLGKFMGRGMPYRVDADVAVHLCDFQPPFASWGWTLHRDGWVKFTRSDQGRIQMLVPENAPSTSIGGSSFGIVLFEGNDVEALRKLINDSPKIRALEEGHK